MFLLTPYTHKQNFEQLKSATECDMDIQVHIWINVAGFLYSQSVIILFEQQWDRGKGSKYKEF